MIEIQRNFIHSSNKLAILTIYTKTGIKEKRPLESTGIPQTKITELASQLALVGDQLTVKYNSSKELYKGKWRLFGNIAFCVCFSLVKPT